MTGDELLAEIDRGIAQIRANLEETPRGDFFWSRYWAGYLKAYEDLRRLTRTPPDTLQAGGDVERWRAALESIAGSTCCDGCNEAKRVAIAALTPAGQQVIRWVVGRWVDVDGSAARDGGGASAEDWERFAQTADHYIAGLQADIGGGRVRDLVQRHEAYFQARAAINALKQST